MTISQIDAGPTERIGGSPVRDFDELVSATGRQFHRAALLLTGGDHHLAEDLESYRDIDDNDGWVHGPA